MLSGKGGGGVGKGEPSLWNPAAGGEVLLPWVACGWVPAVEGSRWNRESIDNRGEK